MQWSFGLEFSLGKWSNFCKQVLIKRSAGRHRHSGTVVRDRVRMDLFRSAGSIVTG